jgi:hypothetical protein
MVGDPDSTLLAYMLERQIDQPTSRFARPDFRRISNVRLLVSSPHVTADFLSGDEIIASVNLGAPDHSAECDGHVLKLRTATSGAAPPFVLGVGRYRTYLYLANDESIVMRSGADDVVLAVVVPFGNSEYDWYRFARKPKQ